jgi:hypothetical protein
MMVDMWIFSTVGFFSVTQVQESPEVLQVRARVRKDLDSLRKTYLPDLSATVEILGRDYPYRAYIDRPKLGEAMVRMVTDLTYSNFKSAVAKAQGYERSSLYHDVWAVMLNAERTLDRREAQTSFYDRAITGFALGADVSTLPKVSRRQRKRRSKNTGNTVG